MTPPAELLERALAAHGDTLYRFALLMGGDERAAEALLRDLVAAQVGAWHEAAPPAPPDEAELLAGLAVAARAAEARRTARRRPPPPPGPFALGRLPVDQRLALGLHLLLGYDAARSGRVLGVGQDAALAALTDAVRAVGPAAGHSLPDRISGDLCLPVRAALTDPSSGARHGAAVRGHLATCALCRSFDLAWSETLAAVEAQLRGALRERALPPALAARLIAMGRPARRSVSPTLRRTLPALAVLALIAALVLPGFLRAPVRVVERDEAAVVDPQQLLARAIERQTTVPANRGPVWHARYETLWFFDQNIYAPLTAEIWLDPQNPARHRLQLTHADGGAPYELQLGNGRSRLYYALDATYAPALYGNLPTRARAEGPALLVERLDSEGQERARDERLATGPWSIAPSYLRQAQSAADLRVLGRQRDRGRTVQILSFSGISPLGLPPDAPGATAERVTVLLALDIEDGLLRSATELAGPVGAEQVSRVTWRLVDEQWLATGQQIDAAFDVGRAWTGVGDFSETGVHQSADLAVPLIAANAVTDPARLFGDRSAAVSIWAPSRAPAGVDRALLLWSEAELYGGRPPQGIIYLGPGRRLVLAFNRSRPVEGEPVQAGDWSGDLRAGPTHRYSLNLSRPAGSADQGEVVAVDAFGFTRDELLEVVESMRPFDLDSLLAQADLFHSGPGDPEARSLLLGAVALALPPAGAALLIQGRQYTRHAPAGALRRDPYASPHYEGRGETALIDEWAFERDGPALFTELLGTEGGSSLTQLYFGKDTAWRYVQATDSGYRYGVIEVPMLFRLPGVAQIALELLATDGQANPASDGPVSWWSQEPSGRGGELRTYPGPDGGTVISRSEAAAGSPRYGWLLGDERGAGEPYLYDLQPETITTELAFARDGALRRVEVFAESAAGLRTLLQRYELLARAERPLADVPAAIRSDGGMPEAAFVVEYSDGRPRVPASIETSTLAEALGAAPGDVYLLAGAQPELVEQGSGQNAVDHGDVLENAVGRRLALRLSYMLAAGEGEQASVLRITQGPAGPFAAYLRARGGLPWASSEPVRLTIAGREVDGWTGAGEQGAYLAAELDGTLIVVESSARTFAERDLAALAGMRRAARP
jgi:hypothetical protein